MDRPDPPLPTFLIIGAQKSATRWLRSNLGKHPDVYTPDEEISFFTNRRRFRRLGLSWYREQFAGWDGEPVLGEATPGYMIPRHDPKAMAKRIDHSLPDVRLIALLRNPIDRAESALRHHMRRGRIPKRTRLVKAVGTRGRRRTDVGLVEGGLYADSLRPYLRTFGDRLLVMLHDDVLADPGLVYQRSLRHIGADPSFVPPGLADVVFSNRASADADGPTDDERRKLWPLFRTDVRRLQKMIHRDLSMWDPTRVPPRIDDMVAADPMPPT